MHCRYPLHSWLTNECHLKWCKTPENHHYHRNSAMSTHCLKITKYVSFNFRSARNVMKRDILSRFLSLINLLFDTFHRLLKLQFFWVINSFWWLVCLTFWTSIRSSFFSSKRGLVEVQVSLVVVMHKFALPLYLPCIVKTLGLV